MTNTNQLVAGDPAINVLHIFHGKSQASLGKLGLVY